MIDVRQTRFLRKGAIKLKSRDGGLWWFDFSRLDWFGEADSGKVTYFLAIVTVYPIRRTLCAPYWVRLGSTTETEGLWREHISMLLNHEGCDRFVEMTGSCCVVVSVTFSSQTMISKRIVQQDCRVLTTRL